MSRIIPIGLQYHLIGLDLYRVGTMNDFLCKSVQSIFRQPERMTTLNDMVGAGGTRNDLERTPF